MFFIMSLVLSYMTLTCGQIGYQYYWHSKYRIVGTYKSGELDIHGKIKDDLIDPNHESIDNQSHTKSNCDTEYTDLNLYYRMLKHGCALWIAGETDYFPPQKPTVYLLKPTKEIDDGNMSPYVGYYREMGKREWYECSFVANNKKYRANALSIIVTPYYQAKAVRLATGKCAEPWPVRIVATMNVCAVEAFEYGDITDEPYVCDEAARSGTLTVDITFSYVGEVKGEKDYGY